MFRASVMTQMGLLFILVFTFNVTYGSLLDPGVLNIDDVDEVQLKHVKQINTKKHSVFYNLIPADFGFLCFYRRHYRRQKLGICELNKEFDLLYDSCHKFPGEDPRTFFHRGVWFVTDNTFGKNAIYQLHEKSKNDENEIFSDCIFLELKYGKHSKRHLDGKNPSYISDGKDLYFIKWFYPLEIYQFDEEFNNPCLVYLDKTSANDSYRGGTAGFPTPRTNIFIGFGHHTTQENGVLRHRPFIWELNMNNFTVKTKILDIESSMNIIDPVTIVQCQDKLYLITAESEWSWFQDQNYMANVWEIVTHKSWHLKSKKHRHLNPTCAPTSRLNTAILEIILHC